MPETPIPSSYEHSPTSTQQGHLLPLGTLCPCLCLGLGPGLLCALVAGTQDVTRLAPSGDGGVDVATVVLGLAHVGEAGAAGALGAALDDVNADDVAAVDLEPHLHTDLGQGGSQQDGRVDAGAADRQAHAREGLYGPARRHHQHVADLDALPVGSVKQPRSRAPRVHVLDLLLVKGRQRVGGRGALHLRRVHRETGAELGAPPAFGDTVCLGARG